MWRWPGGSAVAEQSRTQNVWAWLWRANQDTLVRIAIGSSAQIMDGGKEVHTVKWAQ